MAARGALAVTCRNAGEARWRIDEAVPDLIVLDAPPGEADVLSLLEPLRSDPSTEAVPVFVATTLLTFSAGPIQAWTAWRLSNPSVGRHKAWFVFYGLASQLFYAEFKNVINRTAHIKEGMRERKWKVTPRAVPTVKSTEPVGASPAAAFSGDRYT